MGFMDTLKGWFGKAKTEAAELSEKAAPMVDKAKEMGGDAFEKVKDVAEDIGEAAGDSFDKAKDFVEDKMGKGDDVVADHQHTAEGPVEQPQDKVEGQ